MNAERRKQIARETPDVMRQVEVICFKRKVLQEHLFGRDRRARAVEARRDVIDLLRAKPYEWSWPEIGRFLERDHKTCMYHHHERHRGEAVHAE